MSTPGRSSHLSSLLKTGSGSCAGKSPAEEFQEQTCYMHHFGQEVLETPPTYNVKKPCFTALQKIYIVLKCIDESNQEHMDLHWKARREKLWPKGALVVNELMRNKKWRSGTHLWEWRAQHQAWMNVPWRDDDGDHGPPHPAGGWVAAWHLSQLACCPPAPWSELLHTPHWGSWLWSWCRTWCRSCTSHHCPSPCGGSRSQAAWKNSDQGQWWLQILYSSSAQLLSEPKRIPPPPPKKKKTVAYCTLVFSSKSHVKTFVQNVKENQSVMLCVVY